MNGRIHWKQLAAFGFLGVVSIWTLAEARDTNERTVRIETGQRVNTCVEDSPAACQRELNNLLRHATPSQRKFIRWAARENARLLRRPAVRSPKKVENRTPAPLDKPSKPRSALPPSLPIKPIPSTTPDEPVAVSPEPPPGPQGTSLPPSELLPDPEPPPTEPTVTVPPAACEPLPTLPVCP